MSKVIKKYKIHDNGGRPFLVYVNGLNIKIYTQSVQKPLQDNMKEEYSYLMDYKVKKVFIGRSRKETSRFIYDGDYEYIGNSILLEIEKKLNINRYLYIGWEIYEFTTNEPIIRYYSLVGNSDVPYPVAISENYVYFFLDKKYVPRCLFSDNISWINAYSDFYAHTSWQSVKFMKKNLKDIPKFKDTDIKKMKTKLIHKRIW